jgi:hypothetical protein
VETEKPGEKSLLELKGWFLFISGENGARTRCSVACLKSTLWMNQSCVPDQYIFPAHRVVLVRSYGRCSARIGCLPRFATSGHPAVQGIESTSALTECVSSTSLRIKFYRIGRPPFVHLQTFSNNYHSTSPSELRFSVRKSSWSGNLTKMLYWSFPPSVPLDTVYMPLPTLLTCRQVISDLLHDIV